MEGGEMGLSNVLWGGGGGEGGAQQGKKASEIVALRAAFTSKGNC